MVILLLSSQTCTSSREQRLDTSKSNFASSPASQFPPQLPVQEGKQASLMDKSQGNAPFPGLSDQEVLLWPKCYFYKYVPSLITTKIFQTFFFSASQKEAIETCC